MLKLAFADTAVNPSIPAWATTKHNSDHFLFHELLIRAGKTGRKEIRNMPAFTRELRRGGRAVRRRKATGD